MIPFKNRFHGHNSLTYTYKNGQTIRSKLFSIKFCANPRKRFSRVAVVVSKKVAKKAVQRNFLRRRLYSLIQRNYDLIIIIHSADLGQVNFAELETKIIAELKSQQILR